MSATAVRMKDLPMVYVVGSHDLKCVKIGKTKSIKNRLSNLQSGCPFRIMFWCSIRTPNPGPIEKYLHAKFSQHRLQGEWFALPDESLDWLAAYCAKQNQATRSAL